MTYPLYRGHPDFGQLPRTLADPSWIVQRPSRSPCMSIDTWYDSRAEADAAIALLPEGAGWKLCRRGNWVSGPGWSYWPTAEERA